MASATQPRVHELPKLPQARMYLKSAQWGLSNLLEQKLSGYGYRFHVIGTLASLRAVQHALDGHDRILSLDHQQVIGEWWTQTKNSTAAPLQFIRHSRNLILKKGTFESYASRHEISSGGKTRVEYEIVYYDESGKRRDLAADINTAIGWCDKELAGLEARLPARFESEKEQETREWDFLDNDGTDEVTNSV